MSPCADPYAEMATEPRALPTRYLTPEDLVEKFDLPSIETTKKPLQAENPQAGLEQRCYLFLPWVLSGILVRWVFAGQERWARSPGGRRLSSLATVERPRTAQGRPDVAGPGRARSPGGLSPNRSAALHLTLGVSASTQKQRQRRKPCVPRRPSPYRSLRTRRPWT